jgi:hypothetical protein
MTNIWMNACSNFQVNRSNVGYILTPNQLIVLVVTFFEEDIDISLYIKPVIARLPFFVRVNKSDIKVPHELRDQLVHLAERNLEGLISVRTNVDIAASHLRFCQCRYVSRRQSES